jgi:hypothetical protein
MINKLEEVLKTQFEELVNEGRQLNSLIGQSGSVLRAEQVSRVSSWVSRAGQLIKNTSSPTGVYYEQFSSTIKQAGTSFYQLHSNHYAHFATLVGCLEGACSDFKKGLLQEIKSILRAEIFGDFIEMSEYLLKEGYKDAAAVILGAVLEDTLRKVAVNSSIDTNNFDGSPKNLERLNQDIYKANVYDKLIQKQITSWGDLRNKAAHGEFEKYDADQVRMMLLFVQKFCSDYVR